MGGSALDHAVVLGSGIGGLSAAAVLAPRAHRVTVIERDTPGAGTDVRSGVPQGAHIHSLVAHGLDLLDQIVPGFAQELLDKGANAAELLSDVRLNYFGSTLAQIPIGLHVALASRPFLEAHLRQRVTALDNVTILEATTATDLVTARAHNRVTGVRTTDATPSKSEAAGSVGGREIACDLVVDALGRTGRSATWLSHHGWERPKEARTRIDIAYTSRHYRAPGGLLGKDKALLVGPRPDRPRGLLLASQEHDQWVLSLCAYGKRHHAPTRPDAFTAYANALLPAEVVEQLAAAEPLDDPVSFGFPSAIRRLHDRQSAPPDGLVAVGESVSSLNPIYGTGMTAAITEAVLLGRCLDAGRQNLPRRYYRAVAQTLRFTWLFASLADRTMPEVPGVPPLARTAMGNWFTRTMAVASVNEEMATAIMKVIDMTENPARLLHPKLLLPVLTAGRRTSLGG